MIEKMREIATAEGIAIDDAALGAIAYRADGGLRDALTMLEQLGGFLRRQAGNGGDARLRLWIDGTNVRARAAGRVVARDAAAALRTSTRRATPAPTSRS